MTLKKYILFTLLCFLYQSSQLFCDTDPNRVELLKTCQVIVNDDKLIKYFKKLPVIQRYIENVSKDRGAAYSNVILKEYPEALIHLDDFKENDKLGKPLVYSYEGFGAISPTTLSYIKIACDLYRLFGDLKDMHIVEIGGGYGGLCKIIHNLCGFASYTFIDDVPCLLLKSKFLEEFAIPNVFYVGRDQINSMTQNYDLVISNFEFTRMDRNAQAPFVQQVLSKVANGYMLCDQVMGAQSLSRIDLITFLINSGRKGKYTTEWPFTDSGIHLLYWQPNVHVEENVPLPKRVDPQQNAITYGLSAGRLGDNLLAYAHAKWIAYKYKLPFFYVPFIMSEKFELSKLETQAESTYPFAETIVVKDLKEIDLTKKSTLFVVPYFPNARFEYNALGFSGTLPYFDVEWEDPGFKHELQQSMTPIDPVSTMDLPNDLLTVAVHVRRGGGLDNYAHVQHVLPLKFPPDLFFVDQLKLIRAIFPQKKLFVYIFTDHLNPEHLAFLYRGVLMDPNISFYFREKNNGPFANILEDFFSMTKFDCLIRGESNYSIMAAKLGDYCLEIAPMHSYEYKKKLYINQVEIAFKGPLQK